VVLESFVHHRLCCFASAKPDYAESSQIDVSALPLWTGVDAVDWGRGRGGVLFYDSACSKLILSVCSMK
jgi:hypothetical protein